MDDLQLMDLMGRQRPLSRSSAASRSSAKQSPPMPRVPLPSLSSTSKAKMSLGSSRAGYSSHMRKDSRDTRASMDDTYGGGLISSPSSHTLRSRQSVGAGNHLRASARPTRPAATPARDQPGGSKSMIGDMFKRMRALEKRLADTRNGMAVNDLQSAIPRPSSRLSSSIGPGGGGANLTPRKSIDSRRDDVGTPSSIPVPLSKSTSTRRPTSRLSMASGADMSHLPSSARCQTPTMEHATLDFLDQDPSKLRRRSHLAMPTGAAVPPSVSSTRPRGSTVTASGHPVRTDPLRKSVHPGTGRPAPPVSWRPSQSSRPRSSSIGSNS